MTYDQFAIEFAQAKRAFDDEVEVDAGAIIREADRQRAFDLALALTDALDPDPIREREHWIDDRLCLTLDEAVRALLAVAEAA